MRIIVNGQQAFGQTVLERLIERKEEVIGVYCPEDRPDGRLDPVKQAAEKNGIPVFQPKSFKTPEAATQLASLAPDLAVMAFVTKFVPSEVLNIPKLGSIQYHPSLLPRHRGPSSINWPIIQGETRTGLTIFWPDDGLDTGPILLQKETEIGPDDTLGSVYFDRLFPMGVEAMMEAIDLVRDGKAPKIVQDEGQATYESWCRRDNVEIDWSKPAGEVYNLIRGSNPQPGAWTRYEGAVVQIFDAARLEAQDGEPGTVTAIGDDGIAIAAAGGGILAKRVRGEGGDKIAGAEFAAARSLSAGARLG